MNKAEKGIQSVQVRKTHPCRRSITSPHASATRSSKSAGETSPDAVGGSLEAARALITGNRRITLEEFTLQLHDPYQLL